AQSLDNLGISAIREKLEHLLVKFLKDSTISWCPVMEARPEVTIRRDSHTHLSFFEEKSVSIWGCGALGAHIAVYLCRAGVRKLTLRDHGLVTPGILVRQPYTYRDIGKQKVEALKEKLLSINPDLEISEYYSDIVYELGKPDFVWSDGADVVIDATASQLVRMRLETVWNSANQPHIPVASLMVDQTATHLMTGIAQGHFSGATWDLFRKAKLELLRDSMYLPFADSFFPNGDDIRKPFQPEPGCSEPTFIGSSADSAGLAGIGLNLIATAVSTDSPGGTVQFFSQNSNQSRLPAPTIFTFKSDMIFYATPYTVRISPDALSELCAVINQNRRIRGKNIETGGLIWGEWDDGMQVVWISNVSGPPQDSFQSENSFRCGREGTSEEHRIRQDWSRLSVGYLGMWHTHPNSQPFPSPTDEHGMAEILSSGPLPPRKQALLITGIISGETYLGCYLFERTSLKICLIGKEIQPFPNVKL
ncbi:MAG: ThiF family adenylyltransferase, partial [Nitrospira sp.]|nr:ThiF family adenylyltransferase [Nitrospira sp.]